jgi:hypothetical protein
VTRRWLRYCVSVVFLAAMVVWPISAGATRGPRDLNQLTVPIQPVVPPSVVSAITPPPPLLRVVELPARLTAAQFQRVVEEVESSTSTRRTVLIAPSFVAMPSPPSPDLITHFALASGPDTAAVVLTPGSANSDASTFNAAALLYARIPQRLLTGNLTLRAGNAPESWSILATNFQACSALCDPLAAAQSVPYHQLLAAGGEPVASPHELLADLQPQSRATITLERYMPLSAIAFASLFPPAQHPHHPARSKENLPVVPAAALLGVLLIAGGVALWFLARRRQDVAGRPAPPDHERRRPRPTRRAQTDGNAFLPVIGPGEVADAAIHSGFSPEGYVEIDECLVRAIWSDPSPAPKPGQTVTARLVDGALQATRAGASTSRMER